MNTKNLFSIAKILLLGVFLLVTFSTTNIINSETLAKTSAEQQLYGPNKLKTPAVSKEPECDGVWVNSSATEKIYLNAINLKDWGADSSPSIILDTYNIISKNYLIIGHNVCYFGKCDEARSQFANIMKLNIGDKVSACLGGLLYTGYIFTSEPIPDTRTSVMGDWTGFNTITMFTSYGNCKDAQCSSTNQRWMVAFERDK